MFIKLHVKQKTKNKNKQKKKQNKKQKKKHFAYVWHIAIGPKAINWGKIVGLSFRGSTRNPMRFFFFVLFVCLFFNLFFGQKRAMALRLNYLLLHFTTSFVYVKCPKIIKEKMVSKTMPRKVQNPGAKPRSLIFWKISDLIHFVSLLWKHLCRQVQYFLVQI